MKPSIEEVNAGWYTYGHDYQRAVGDTWRPACCWPGCVRDGRLVSSGIFLSRYIFSSGVEMF